ncbi:MAG: 16S rRNA (cytosine(1402)-N(4))-methyltransferase RsmH, partial [Planctomycetota bacterium]
FDDSHGQPAWQWLQSATEKQIADAIYQFGEERFSRRIARRVVDAKKTRRPIRTVGDMVQVCRSSVPRSKNHDIHPATRTFQALRIAVNDELQTLTRALQRIPEWVAIGGRIAIISFHSLEDRIVKNAFRDDPRFDVLTRKPIVAGDAEIARNPRARSAKLRVAQRVDG